jgi:hypothetical protein
MCGALIWNHLQSKHVHCISEDKIKEKLKCCVLKCCIYLQVLVPSQRHGSGLLLGHLLPKDGAVIADDGLDLCLIVHIHDELLTARGGHHIRPSLVSSFTSEEILHTKTMYPYIISRMCNECDIFYIIVRLTHNSCFTRSTLLLNSLPSRSTASVAMGVVVKGVGWARHSGVHNQSREVFPAQQADDTIGVATMTPGILHNHPRPVQVININVLVYIMILNT